MKLSKIGLAVSAVIATAAIGSAQAGVSITGSGSGSHVANVTQQGAQRGQVTIAQDGDVSHKATVVQGGRGGYDVTIDQSGDDSRNTADVIQENGFPRDSVVDILQDGGSNSATVHTIGGPVADLANSFDVDQIGSDNTVDISTDLSSGQAVAISQTGPLNTAIYTANKAEDTAVTITQVGGDNTADVSALANSVGNAGTVTQTGNSHTADVDFLANGVDNTATVDQTDSRHMATVSMRGTGNTATVDQSGGDESEATVSFDGNGAKNSTSTVIQTGDFNEATAGNVSSVQATIDITQDGAGHRAEVYSTDSNKSVVTADQTGFTQEFDSNLTDSKETIVTATQSGLVNKAEVISDGDEGSAVTFTQSGVNGTATVGLMGTTATTALITQAGTQEMAGITLGNSENTAATIAQSDGFMSGAEIAVTDDSDGVYTITQGLGVGQMASITADNASSSMVAIVSEGLDQDSEIELASTALTQVSLNQSGNDNYTGLDISGDQGSVITIDQDDTSNTVEKVGGGLGVIKDSKLTLNIAQGAGVGDFNTVGLNIVNANNSTADVTQDGDDNIANLILNNVEGSAILISQLSEGAGHFAQVKMTDVNLGNASITQTGYNNQAWIEMDDVFNSSATIVQGNYDNKARITFVNGDDGENVSIDQSGCIACDVTLNVGNSFGS